jgi:hypothetical protein
MAQILTAMGHIHTMKVAFNELSNKVAKLETDLNALKNDPSVNTEQTTTATIASVATHVPTPAPVVDIDEIVKTVRARVLTDLTKELNSIETKLDQSVGKLVRARVEHAMTELKDELTQHVEDIVSVGTVSNAAFDIGDIEITTSNIVETATTPVTTSRRGRKKNSSTTAVV